MTQENKKRGIGRRKFLTGAALAGAGTLAMPQISRAQTTKLTMQSSWPVSDIFQEMAQQYADRVSEMSGGRLEIDLQPAGAIVAAFSVQDACHDGVLDAAHTVSAYWYGKNKAASLFGTGPVFGIDGAQIIAWFQYGGGQELYNELVQEVLGLNVVGFYAFAMPTQPFGWFSREPTSIEDIQGLKYRTVGLSADLNQAMGLAVTQLPGGEIVPAMERGVIDAFEYNNPTSDRRFGAQDVVKNYMLGSYHQACEAFELIFNKDRFDSLEPELQAILRYAAEAANTANYGLAMDNYSKDLQALIDDAGVNVKRTPQSIMEAQLEAWDKVIEPLMEDDLFKRIVESQKAWAERVGFYSLMNSADYKAAYDHYFPGKLTY
ncbi:TRAP-type mannitol/chloroaromatic compound transport system substrate-binding protein [Mesorhizobium sp. J18]|uniref:TRAP transporter substrate-binding protein n=1 Tax=Mesorhizobium sp. J18 TaxID=935263 RepID=UPI001199A347|nr:TRAP transporter substrate-binding protein [Mesorhizobium sp. J18]TWG97918.1 TRAP-type mannitol/chloroaromatic compound transport system substrate-binding protein [Mesorhizobium sp. J18]